MVPTETLASMLEVTISMIDELFKIWKIDIQAPIGLIFDVDELLYNNET